MKEEVKNSAIMTKFNEVRKAAGLKEATENKNVGNNGYVIGQEFILDGTIAPEEVKDANGKTTAVYLALGTQDGTKLSLQSLMGLTSLRGYATTGEETDSTGTKFTASVAEGVDENFVGWRNLPSRDLYEVAYDIEQNPNNYKGKSVTFKGMAIRVWTAKKGGTDLNTGVSFAKGAKRVSSVKLWEVL